MQYRAGMTRTVAILLLASTWLAIAVTPSAATVFGNVRGVVHDPQHHPIDRAHATSQGHRLRLLH